MDLQSVDGYWLAALLIGAGVILALSAHRLQLRSRTATFSPLDSRLPPPCVIRLLRADDIETCEAIYLLNEAHFPPDMFDLFSQCLREGKALFLVAESNRQVVAFGGLVMHRTGSADRANLVYGMVHPSFQDRGYGTALLRARLAMLPLTRRGWVVVITVTGGSETFYSRFGFRYLRSAPRKGGRLLDEYIVLVRPRAQKQCARSVAEILVPVPFGSTYVPRFASSTEPT